MLTFFSTPKPFSGHINVIQRNALRSWTLLHPGIEVILFGDEEGTGRACSELGLRHVDRVKRSESGAKYVNDIFGRAQEIAKHNLVCYANCDIVLTQDFLRAIERLQKWRKSFLMIGRRRDTDVTTELEFSQPDWQDALAEIARKSGRQRSAYEIDYFVFPRGLYQDIPPMVNGRIHWDNWLVWKAGSLGLPVVDATPVVLAVHQNHDYSYHPGGRTGVWEDIESERNRRLAGGFWHLHTIDHASHVLEPRSIRRTNRRRWVEAKRVYERVRLAFLDFTRPVRHRLGLRRSYLSKNQHLAQEAEPEKTDPARLFAGSFNSTRGEGRQARSDRPSCPRCGSMDYWRAHRRTLELLIRRGPMARCRTCGRRFPFPKLEEQPNES